jgi:diacylglycerol kinase (ATP)
MTQVRLALRQGDSHTATPKFDLAARLRSFTFAWRGIALMLGSQHNAWIHAVATCLVVVAGFGFTVSRYEWLALLFAVVSVWTAEALNTALEALCDVASPQLHPLVARAKDVAAGAVLICAAGALVTAGLVFGPHLAQRW